MQVLLFAGLAESCGGRTLDVPVDAPLTVQALRDAAEQRCPRLVGQRFRVAVNARYAADDACVPADAEVAFLPPVSGG